MSASLPIAACSVLFAATSDPAGDVYSPGDPSSPAFGSLPDLISGDGRLDAAEEALRFAFMFAEPVFPADDFLHFTSQLHGFVDIDLDVPPSGSGSSRKSDLSGYESGLGAEAYIDLSLVAGGRVSLLDPLGAPMSDVSIAFEDTSVSIAIPYSALFVDRDPTDRIAYAAYFVDASGGTADVFPNGNGHIVVPDPSAGVLAGLAFLGWLVEKKRAAPQFP